MMVYLDVDGFSKSLSQKLAGIIIDTMEIKSTATIYELVAAIAKAVAETAEENKS